MPLICGCGENLYTYKGHPLSGVWNLFGVPSLSAEEIEIRQELQREARLTQIFSRHPEWSKSIKQDILDGVIRTGMTKEQVELAWERPLKFLSGGSDGYSRYETSIFSRDEQGLLRFYDYYFTFHNDKLESWSYYPQYRY